jgi:hypothetical protein
MMDDNALVTVIAAGDDQALRTLCWKLTNANVVLSVVAGGYCG